MTDRYPPKRPGQCVCCGDLIYEVRQTVADPTSPLFGTPARVGAMLVQGTQLEFLMSDGSEADIACCIGCAQELTPTEYGRVWEACVDAADASARRAGRSENVRRAQVGHLMSLLPVALLRKRREGADPQTLVVDRR